MFTQLGLYLRSYLVASFLGRGGRYVLEAAMILALGEAIQDVSEGRLYVLRGAATFVLVATFLLRRWWLPGCWRTVCE